MLNQKGPQPTDPPEDQLPDVIVYSVGILVCCICYRSTLTPEQARDIAAEEMGRPVHIAADEHFATGEPNPCPCDKYPEQRQHRLLEF